MPRTGSLSWLAALLAATFALHASSKGDEPNVARRVAEQRAQAAIDRGVAWLLRQQAHDGAWRSATYGSMRGGVGNSALAVDALAAAWPSLSAAQQRQVRRGMKFLTANLDPAGFVRAPDGSSDYPNYATALTVLALQRANLPQGAEPQRRMRRYLANSLLKDRRAGANDDAPAGGWEGRGGDQPQIGLAAANVSATRFILEALEGSAESDDVRASALAYLAKLQIVESESADRGGFFFTIVPEDPLNKAGWTLGAGGRPRPRAYGTATADGYCALLAAGLSHRDPRTRAALDWLLRHDDVATVPGVPDPSVWIDADSAALRYYYFASLARAIHRSGDSRFRRRAVRLTNELITRQRDDGSWTNESHAMREDDPLIATSLAVDALARLATIESD